MMKRLALLIFVLVANSASAQSLHRRIDDAIAAGHKGSFAKPCTDAEFVRRVHLDFTGVIPTAADVRKFLDDKNPNKRARLVDSLLKSPDFPRRMQEAIHVMFEERRENKESPLPEWEEFLLASFAADKPFDQLAREILAADGKPAATNKFYVDRNGDTHLVTRDVARLFLGRDIECSQCHDHPTVEDYKQADYFGLYAFLNRTYVAKQGKETVLAEKAIPGPVDFQSVFDMVKMKTGPRLPDGKEIDEPVLAKGEEYEIKPNPKEKQLGVPKFRPRGLMAAELTKSPVFARNIANRLWFLMMGRGVVHPLDQHHGGNLPAQPKLLDVLTDGLVELKFDVKAFLREIALSEAYQRSSILPGKEEIEDGSFAVARLRPLSPEQLVFSVARATGGFDPLIRDKTEPAARAKALRAAYANPLKGFVVAFGSRAGEAEVEFQPSLAGALYLSNDKTVLAWLDAKDDNLTARLAKLSGDFLADEMYSSVLSRTPTADERTEVAEHLKRRGDQRTLAIRELCWALIASAEFRLIS